MRIVSAYYKIPSKQPHSFYLENMKRFFEQLKAPILFFTDEECLLELKPLAKENVEFRVKPFESLEIFKNFDKAFWEKQIEVDIETYHTWQLGAVWANKHLFAKEAFTEYPDEDWFLWVDAGCIRKDSWAPYTEKTGLRKYPLDPGVYVQSLNPIPRERVFFRYPDQFIAGGLILFHRDHIDNYIKEYAFGLMKYGILKLSGIMDQYVIAHLSQQFSFIHCVDRKLMTEYVQGCPDPWFFFLAFL